MSARKVLLIAPVALFACLAALGLVVSPRPRAPRLMQRAERLLGTTVTIAAHSEPLGYTRTADAISSAFAEVMRLERTPSEAAAPADLRTAEHGRAADRAIEVLRRSGVREGRVEIGGETRTLGRERPASAGPSRTRPVEEGAPE